MRFVITAVVLLTLVATPVFGQQPSNEAFQIVDPRPAEAAVPNELLYFSQPNQPVAQQQVAPPTKAAPRQFATNPARAVRPSLDQRTRGLVRKMPTLGSFAAEDSSTVTVTNPDQPYQRVSAPISARKTGGAYMPAKVNSDYQPQVYIESGEPVEIRNHNFFGIDREECCDEWAGLCGCGAGLKANPGHWGCPWLHGHDACEPQKCPWFHSRKGTKGCKHGRCGHGGKHCKSKCGGGSCGSKCDNAGCGE